MPLTIGPGDRGTDDQPPPGVTENPSGYVRPGGGYDPDGDGVLNPMRAAQISERHEVRDAAGSGSFSLDIDAMRALRPKWEGVRDRLRKLMNYGDQLKNVTKPANDRASDKQIQAAMDHQKLYAAIIQQQYEYAEAYVDALDAAITKYERADHTAGEGVRSAGHDL